MLNDRVLPLLESHGIELLQVHFDRDSEFYGRRKKHNCQLFLAVHDIDHTRTKACTSQTNGIYKRFHRTVKEEFCEVAFRQNVYTELEALQTDLDAWVDTYNNERSRQGKMCYVRKPIQMLFDGREVWQEKVMH